MVQLPITWKEIEKPGFRSEGQIWVSLIMDLLGLCSLSSINAALPDHFPTPATGAAVSALEVMEGGSVSLSCRYSVKRHGLTRVCWGRSCGTLWCGDILAQTDGEGVVSKVSDRYRVVGDVLSGQVDLVIPRVKQRDEGSYCCRVDIDGYFNDKKVLYTMKVVKRKWYHVPFLYSQVCA